MSFPTPFDNPHNCPVCGFNPCGADCDLGFTEGELEELEASFEGRPWPVGDEDDFPSPWLSAPYRGDEGYAGDGEYGDYPEVDYPDVIPFGSIDDEDDDSELEFPDAEAA